MRGLPMRIVLLPLSLLILPNAAAAPPEVEYFETHIRPILVEHCHSCHGPKKQMSGLRLDSRAALLEGGDNGPVIRPGKPEESPLVLAIRHGGERKMPPKYKI